MYMITRNESKDELLFNNNILGGWKMKRKIYLLFTIIAALFVALAGCGSGSDSGSGDSSSETGASGGGSDGDTVKVGIIGAFQMAAGAEIEANARLAIDEINANGGIDGKQIEAYFYDTKADPEEGRAVAERLLYQDKVDFIIGEHRSEVTLAVQPIIMEEKKIFINTGSASPQLTQNVLDDYDTNKYTFSTQLDSLQLGEGYINQLKDMVDEYGFEKIALIGESAVWVDPVEEMFKETFGDKAVLIERPATDTEDFSIELSRVQESGAEVVMQVFSGDQGIIFAQQWADREIPVILTGYNVQAQSGEFWDQTGGKAQSLITWKHGVRSEITEKTVPYWDSFVEEYGRIPGPYTGLNTYDAVLILAQAIEEAGTTDTEALVETFENGSFTGAGGIIEFNERHGINVGEELVPFTFIQWQDGEQVTVWPKSISTGEVTSPPWLDN